MVWLDGYTKVTYPHSPGLAVAGPPTKALVHTTQGSTFAGADSVYRRIQACPHVTVSKTEDLLIQHVDTQLGAYALRNLPGGVETNTVGVIQIEVVGFAGTLSDGYLSWLGERCLGPLIAAHPTIPIEFADFDGPRFTPQEWLSFAGICGHMHVPENDHWDPGSINTAVLEHAIRSYLGADDMPLSDDDIERIWNARLPLADGQTYPARNVLGFIHGELTRPDLLERRLVDALVVALPVGPSGMSSDAVRTACAQAVREVLGSLG